jgi:anthranilate synthase component I
MVTKTLNEMEITASALPNLLPVVRELPADLETPVSVYLKLAGQGPSFLLESVSGGEHVARYSFIGINPSQAFILKAGVLVKHTASGSEQLDGQNPLQSLRQELQRYRPVEVDGLPRFSGGLVGYLSYDVVRTFEPSVPVTPHPDLPEAIFLLADTVVVFDHAFGRLLLVTNVHLNGDQAASVAEAQSRLDAIQHCLESTEPPQSLPSGSSPLPVMQHSSVLASNITQAQFTQAVLAAKERIAAGDIFQVVLSQRLERRTTATPFNIYRSLRRMNPSPYMYFFDFNGLPGASDLCLIGASPEMHVRLDVHGPEGRVAAIRPIAGTRRRGQTPAEDTLLERELLADPKERAEHVMLVDLARNDLGRVCEYGSVHVTEQLGIERYSHVMHIVSHVEGRLRPELDAFDLMAATFPAGTVSGAPKIRAMQIIHELEAGPRGPYAGAVGYFSYDGSSDTCITIRTLVMRGDTVSVQAGAGIVADSDPETEYQETLMKARALAAAVEKAEGAE